MTVVLGIVGGLVGAVVIIGIMYGVYALIGWNTKRRKALQKQKEFAGIPAEQHKYVSEHFAGYWEDPTTGYIANRKTTAFSDFAATIALLGVTVEAPEPLDLTEPEDPFGLDGGFLNSDDFDEEPHAQHS